MRPAAYPVDGAVPCIGVGHGLVAQAGGQPTRLVRTKVRALHAIGISAKLIADVDRVAVSRLARDICGKAKKRAAPTPSKVQAGVAQLTVRERAVILTAPFELFAEAEGKPMIRKRASQLKRALATAMRAEAPMPLEILRCVRLDQLSRQVSADSAATYYLKVAAEETGTWVMREHDFSE